MHVVISTGADPGRAELDAWTLADDVGNDWGGRFTGCVKRSSYATGFGAWERYLSNANRAFCILLKDDGDDQYQVDVTRFDGGTNAPAPVLIPADDGPPVPCAGSGPWTCDIPRSVDEQRGMLLFRLPEDLDSVGIRVVGTCTAPTPCGETVFDVANISPARASAGFHKTVTTTVSGVGLQRDNRVLLTKEGYDWIGGQVVDAAADGTWLKARFDLSAVSDVGTWHVDVRGPYGRARGAIQLDWGPLQLKTRPTINGTPRVDNILTATAGTWQDEPTSLAYQWRANGLPIRGAIGRAYRLPAKHLGKSISVSVTADTPWHLPSTATGPAVRVGRGTAPTVVRRPRLSGFRDVGGRVWTTPGRWTKQPSSYAYQWYVAGRVLSGATAPSLRLRSWMNGKRVKVVVTARRAGCYSGKAASQAFTVR